MLSLGKFVQYNIMYHLAKAYFMQVSMGMRMFYKAIGWMIHPETKAKYVISSETSCQQLKDMYHPSQLEKRFGGTAETPTQFWPPLMGPDYLPDENDKSHLDLINPEDYEQILLDNPGLQRHPEFIKEAAHNTRDFKYKNEEEEEEKLIENLNQEEIE